MKKYLIWLSLLCLFACHKKEISPPIHHTAPAVFSLPTCEPTQAIGFDEQVAINTLVEIENQHHMLSTEAFSPYHGTVWATYLQQSHIAGDSSYWEYYLQQLADSLCPMPMHCTIYACEALRAGLGDSWSQLSELHEQRWGNREYAGWSIAYLLCTHFGWQAYLVIDAYSPEYEQCKKAFRRHKKYPVYRQPDIPLQALLERGKDDEQIIKLLDNHTFGWGFSYQGWHTWVTRHTELKECNWAGTPSKALGDAPLFIKTPFMEYHDYASHIICFPPQIEDAPTQNRAEASS